MKLDRAVIVASIAGVATFVGLLWLFMAPEIPRGFEAGVVSIYACFMVAIVASFFLWLFLSCAVELYNVVYGPVEPCRCASPVPGLAEASSGRCLVCAKVVQECGVARREV